MDVGPFSILRVVASFPTQANLKEGVNDDLAIPQSATLNTALLQDVMQKISPDDVMEGIVHSALGKRKSPFEQTAKLAKRTRDKHTEPTPSSAETTASSPHSPINKRPEKTRKASIPRSDGKDDVKAITAPPHMTRSRTKQA